ncbi:hypothetical protein C3H64_08910 [Campylobacter jejuni]|nr:hypothetical protein C3H64_08910 [Campylobacter jejuni]
MEIYLLFIMIQLQGLTEVLKHLYKIKIMYNSILVISKIENNVHNGEQKVTFGSVKHLDYGNEEFFRNKLRNAYF